VRILFLEDFLTKNRQENLTGKKQVNRDSRRAWAGYWYRGIWWKGDSGGSAPWYGWETACGKGSEQRGRDKPATGQLRDRCQLEFLKQSRISMRGGAGKI
jgi:hypothetical protein